MAIRRNSSEDASINLTPMIDVVFLLVIFFMVGSKFRDADSRVDVNVPAAGRMRAMSRVPDERVVSVDASGNVTLDDKPMTTDEVTETLRGQQAAYPALRVAVRGDADVKHSRMMEVLHAVRSSGVKQIGMSSRRIRR